MAHYAHARLNEEENLMLEKLVQTTGESISSIVRQGIKFLYQRKVKKRKSALDFIEEYAGILESGYTDLSTNPKHMEGYGE